MQSNICETFLSGFCPKRHLCKNSHKIKTCILGPNCPIQSQCEGRHPPLCRNFCPKQMWFFLNNKFVMCLFSSDQCKPNVKKGQSHQPPLSPSLPPSHAPSSSPSSSPTQSTTKTHKAGNQVYGEHHQVEL